MVGQFFRAFLLPMVCLAKYSGSSSNEDIVDFDFSNWKEMDWNYEGIDSTSINQMAVDDADKLQSNTLTLEDQSSESHDYPFDWREKILKNALSKALTNAALRQKFVEVMPILRVLSPQQRLTLSALISTQISTKPGSELKLDQVSV